MRKYVDEYRHKGLRKQLIDSLRTKGITDEKVLQAMNNTPRHFFMDLALDRIAYEDRAFPIAKEQTISQPYTVAYQTQLLEVKPFEKILEIGTGSTYQACVLAQLGAQVFTIERQKIIFDLNKNFEYAKKFPSIKFFYGDGFEGLPTFAPFDKIIITAAAKTIPPKLVEQLKPGGMMVVPVDEGKSQRMLRITKKQEGTITEERFDLFTFVRMEHGKEIH
ncbi:MAG: protein-L-isoaspartate(D-aspartate) O-methyltransferase [Terrimonas sp.]|nr:protein-L-isoaspartate(D-aspartate) O-methyltransferase [Terrimonas sp.]OJU54680.1 MAG: protein-L-isoaspartate O-methyltransferase [Acinetobacter sp. 39-4]OJY93163.1 MAG: protein-L-isoaspartate O-methyltransferase [Sphingobacteriales bacterium 40-81]